MAGLVTQFLATNPVPPKKKMCKLDPVLSLWCISFAVSWQTRMWRHETTFSCIRVSDMLKKRSSLSSTCEWSLWNQDIHGGRKSFPFLHSDSFESDFSQWENNQVVIRTKPTILSVVCVISLSYENIITRDWTNSIAGPNECLTDRTRVSV